jgi:hypothetical protein
LVSEVLLGEDPSDVVLLGEDPLDVLPSDSTEWLELSDMHLSPEFFSETEDLLPFPEL